MSREQFGLEPTPGKEWSIVTPESVDPIKLLEGEIALRSMARALGWEFTEVVKPQKTLVQDTQLISMSEDVFGTKTYGNFAVQYLSWMRYSGAAEVVHKGDQHYVSFNHSSFHNRFPTFEQRLDVDKYARAPEISRSSKQVLDTMTFPFTYRYYPYGRHQYYVDHAQLGRVGLAGKLIPEALSKEHLTNYLGTPQSESAAPPRDHKLHGSIGRMMDLFCLLAEVKTSVDPIDTEAPGGTVPYDEFKQLAIREGVSTGKLRTLTDKIRGGAYDQLLRGTTRAWGESVLDGNTELYCGQYGAGYRDLSIDHVSVSTLATIKNNYERIAPDLAEVLAAYEDRSASS